MSLVFALTLSLGFGFKALASSEPEPENENVNVSTEPPVVSIEEDSISPSTIDKPKESSYVDLTKEQLNFSGSANNSTLYTNKHFKGKTKISYSVKNSSSSDLKVKIFKAGAFFSTDSFTVKAKSTLTGTISGLDKSDLYYLSFSAPSNFSGYVK